MGDPDQVRMRYNKVEADGLFVCFVMVNGIGLMMNECMQGEYFCQQWSFGATNYLFTTR